MSTEYNLYVSMRSVLVGATHCRLRTVVTVELLNVGFLRVTDAKLAMKPTPRVLVPVGGGGW